MLNRGPDGGPPAGFRLLPDHLDRETQLALVRQVAAIAAQAPFSHYAVPGRPGTGAARMSVAMTAAGAWGWVSDTGGYRYSAHHPGTGRPWPPLPPVLLDLWRALTAYPLPPDSCLINLYTGAARMSLHRDEDEEVADAPILNISLGDTAVFRLGGAARRDPTRSFRVGSGAVMVFAGAARAVFHGVDRILAGSSTVLAEAGAGELPAQGRLNLTLRRAKAP